MMTNEKMLRAIGNISDELVVGAAPGERPASRPVPFRRALALAAALVLVFALSLSALAAADHEPAYRLLYSLSPTLAQSLKPVRLSSTDQDIRFEVLSARAEGSQVKALIAVQDLAGDRLDSTTDLFDSYYINSPYGTSGSCQNAGYDEKTKTATFLITLSNQGGEAIGGDKITFSVGQLLSKKKTFEGPLPGLVLPNAGKTAATTKPDVFYGGGGGDDFWDRAKDLAALRPEDPLYSPTEGVDITAAGFVAGQLHIQVRYHNVLETDNHGHIFFKNASDETTHPLASFSYGLGQERYTQYLFPLTEKELEGLVPYGSFITSDSLVRGNWSVTFPLEKIN